MDLAATAAGMTIASATAESTATAAVTATTIASASNKESTSTWTKYDPFASDEESNSREDPEEGGPLSETTEEGTVPLSSGPTYIAVLSG